MDRREFKYRTRAARTAASLEAARIGVQVASDDAAYKRARKIWLRARDAARDARWSLWEYENRGMIARG